MKLPIPFGNPKTYTGHSGVDFPVRRGTPIPASGNGTVSTLGRNTRGGCYIWVRYDNGPLVGYHHMDNHGGCPEAGTRVREGTRLGYVGSLGKYSTGPHLHSEISGEATTAGYWKYFDANRVVGSRPAGGDIIPIIPEEEEPENDMRIIYNTENSEEARRRALVGEHTFRVITAAESVVLEHSGLKTYRVTSAEWVDVLIGTVENRARLAESNGQRRRVLFNTDDKNDATRRAVVGPGVFRAVTPDESTGERRVWGAPVNVNQAQWDAEKAAALAPAGATTPVVNVSAPAITPADVAKIASDVAVLLKSTLESIPTAEQNGQAARDHIVKA